MNVVLGAHDLQNPEASQQRFSIARLFEIDYDPKLKLNDILLVQVGAGPERSWSQPETEGRMPGAGSVRCRRGIGRSLWVYGHGLNCERGAGH